MNPEIKKFWETTGNLVHGPSAIETWELHKHMGGIVPVYLIEVVCHGDKYRFEKKWYSEEEMLSLIKLIAFL